MMIAALLQQAGLTVWQPPATGLEATIEVPSLVDNLRAAFERVYPVRFTDTPAMPFVVYQPVGGAPVYVDGVAVAREAQFVVTLRQGSFLALSDTADVLFTVLATDPSTQITDQMVDNELEQSRLRLDVELSVLQLAHTLPAVAVWQVDESAGESLATYTLQPITQRWAVCHICQHDDLEAQRLAARTALLGHDIGGRYEPLEFGGGQQVGQFGRVSLWRDFWTQRQYVR
ncbi:hypothetical protein QCD60_24015 [Pokkaliibacter sp. MBI-7]|uniref:hypothetical protein n=1 Tax=Pokkaliibacter sp. MBI-7 TaxID=3040600 RepID=UPI00244821A6|nr:hypothetical protein [Pokkaliibacter sp. MBI-7]MDH2435595.1 hypothetical protein [Pokkaliibacter sp. MBI-7]